MTLSPPKQLTHVEHSTQPRDPLPLSLVAQDVQDAANVGGLFRLADALGVAHLYLLGKTLKPPQPQINRVARSTEQYVPWSHWVDCEALIAKLKAQNFYLVGLEITDQSQDLAQVLIPKDRSIALILGAERTGISQALLNQTNITVHIPMRGQNSSMNLVTAAAIGIYALAQQYKGHSNPIYQGIDHARRSPP
jgi:tRNA G18 (ribose-2'-O)-methylase SpoU